MAMVNIVPIKFKITAMFEILLILTFIAARLYNPIKIYVNPVPKNHKASTFSVLYKKSVNVECIVPRIIKQYRAILYILFIISLIVTIVE